MRTLHLFAGAGGGLLADLILGHTPVAAVEWDRYACQVLRERAAEGWFPGLRVHEGDVRLFDPSEYAGRVDCIHAGFPCQDISHAGKQAGVGTDTRSGLYREVLRIADVVRPQCLYLENVAAILSGGLGTVLGDLAARGYDCRWTCLRAADLGAPHGRDRWWCLAIRDTDSDSEPTSAFDAQAPRLCGHPIDSNAVGVAAQGLEQGSSDAQEWARPDIRPARPLRDGHGWWQSEPDLGRVADGVAARVDRLKALGNGQVPLQAALAWRILAGGV